MTNDFEALLASEGPGACFEDWELHHRTYHVCSFLTLPLVFAGQDLGALILMSPKVGAIHVQMQNLMRELGVQVAQSLYLWSCQDKLETGMGIIP